MRRCTMIRLPEGKISRFKTHSAELLQAPKEDLQFPESLSLENYMLPTITKLEIP